MEGEQLTLSRLFGISDTNVEGASNVILVDEDYSPNGPAVLTLGIFRKLCRDVRLILRSVNVGGVGTNYAAVLPNVGLTPCIFCGIADDSGVACLLNPNLGPSDMEFTMRDMEVNALIIVDREAKDASQKIAQDMNIPVIEMKLVKETNEFKVQAWLHKDDGWCLITPTATYPTDDPPTGQRRVLKLHTSGTTSKPKIVATTQANATLSCFNQINTYGWTQNDVGILVMPLFHVHGLFNGCLGPLAAGARVVIPLRGSFHKQEFWDAASKHKPTFVTAVPTIWQILMNSVTDDETLLNTLSRLRYVRACSSGLPVHLGKQMQQVLKVPVLEAYAMTEASHQMCSNLLTKQNLGTVGFPTGIELAIINENAQIVPLGSPGEICVRGGNVISEYLNLAPDLNKKNFHESSTVENNTKKGDTNLSVQTTCSPYRMFTGETTFADCQKLSTEYFNKPVIGDLSQSRVPERNWLRTGDRGFMHSEGFVQIEGRLKELINRGGEKISPVEVEEVALEHPELSEAAAFGLPDSVLGETVALAITAKSGTEDEAELKRIAKEVRATFEKVAKFKTPRDIYNFPNGLPKGPTGKVQRSLLPQRLEKGQAVY